MMTPGYILRKSVKLAFFALLLWGAWIIVFGNPYDGTDSPSHHSGMAIYTDHGTGCQYLGRVFGGLTPRLDANSKPICGSTR